MRRWFHGVRRAICVLLAAALVLCCAPALGEGGMTGWVNCDLSGEVGLLTTARLQDDFHLAVNRFWLLSEQIPWGTTEASSFMDQNYEVMERKIALLRNRTLTGPDAELLRRFLALVNDWDTRNALGVSPLAPYVEEIAAIQTLDELTEYMVSKERNVFLLDPSTYSVTPDPVQNARYIALIQPMPLVMGDSAEYTTKTTAYGEMLLALSQKSLKTVLTKMGYTDAAAQAIFDNTLALDALLAPSIRPVDDMYDPDYLESILHFYDRAGLEALCGPFPMAQVLDLTGTGKSDTFWVTEPEYLQAMAENYTEENVPLIRDWLIYYLIQFYCQTLDRDTYDALETLKADALGITGIPDDIDIALAAVEDYLPVSLDNLYIQAYCTEEMRQDIKNIIYEVIAHYRIMLENEDWLSPQTKEKALEKLNGIRINAVYPDELEDWSGVSFRSKEEGGTLLEAVLALTNYSYERLSGLINQPVSLDEWNQMLSPASDVNAGYLTSNNSISILAGILGGVFYDENMSYEEKLGGIGFVIGHEISHAFDLDGANFDADGRLSNWWTAEDLAAFRARARRLAAYYDQFVPYKGGVYSGSRVQSEAIADMTAMKCMLAIAKEREGFDYDAFFRQYAMLWRTKQTPRALMVTVATDSHPLGCLRTNVTVQQFEEFYETYDIQPGDGMYLAPEDRIAVW